MASSPYLNLGNIREAIIADAKERETTALTSQINRYINEGHENVILRKDRNWLKQTYTVTMNEDVTGTVTSLTKDSTSVTFASSTTLPTIGANEEWAFKADGFEEIYKINSIASQTVTLASAYLGSTSSSTGGRVFQTAVFINEDIRRINEVYTDRQSVYTSRGPIDVIGPGDYRRKVQLQPDARGYPIYATVFGLDSNQNQKRLQVYPYPDQDYTLKIDAEIYVPVLSADADEPIIPFQYRQVLYWYGLYKLYLYKRNDPQAANAKQSFDTWVAKLDGDLRQETEGLTIMPERRRWWKGFFGAANTRYTRD